ncbi:NAD(P)/FAD-dependent oxidoreductase, partial [Acinetobacter baumannii]|nr:NAD(P)/FAD-dependent oxidoreductase [Acinetobacter baumannii]
MTQNLHHIVIVGGGAGGLELVTQRRETCANYGISNVTLVDHNVTHIWNPLLHEIAV